jgi:hypothetical protein
MLSTTVACLLIVAASANYVVRGPQDPNHFDTVGQVNFQGGHACLTKPKIASVSNEAELRAAVTGAHSIKAVGAGMSWSQNHFSCADYDGTNIVTAGLCSDIELTAARPFYLSPASSARNHVTDDIVVDETHMIVVVKSCVTVQALLEYLANYRTPTFPSGYTLESPSTYYVGMTVGGAISGGTHGVSLSHGGWAGKVLEARAMLANGTTVRASKHWRPRLFAALKAGATRLGILLDVKLGIVIQGDIEEEAHQMDVDEYRKHVRETKVLIDRAMESRAHGGDEAQWRHVLSESELHDRHTVLHVRQGEGRDPKYVITLCKAYLLSFHLTPLLPLYSPLSTPTPSSTSGLAKDAIPSSSRYPRLPAASHPTAPPPSRFLPFPPTPSTPPTPPLPPPAQVRDQKVQVLPAWPRGPLPARRAPPGPADQHAQVAGVPGRHQLGLRRMVGGGGIVRSRAHVDHGHADRDGAAWGPFVEELSE